MIDPTQVSIGDLEGSRAPAVLAELRDVAPAVWVPVLGGWLVTSYDEAMTVMRDADTYTVDHPGFSTAQVVGPSMLSLDGSAHLRHRRPFGRAFRASRVAGHFGPSTTELAAELVERVRPDGRADLRAALAGPLSVSVVADTLGLHDVDSATVLRWYAAIVGAVTDITAGRPARAEATAAMADLDAAVRDALRDTHGDGLLVEAGRVLEPHEVTSNAAVLMFGGIDTTEGMIVNALLHVLGEDALSPEMVGAPDLVSAVVEESLRLEPAASVVDRYATRDVELGGAAIAEGDLVRVSLTAANRDPAIFAYPDAFELHRPNVDRQLAFARGPHSCIAMDLARLETRAALSAVFDRLPGIRLARPVDVGGLVFRKPAQLPVIWDQ